MIVYVVTSGEYSDYGISWNCQIKEGRYGPYIRRMSKQLTFNKTDGIQEHAPYNNLKWISAHVTLDKNSTVEQAKKALLERYAQWKCEREG